MGRRTPRISKEALRHRIDSGWGGIAPGGEPGQNGQGAPGEQGAKGAQGEQELSNNAKRKLHEQQIGALLGELHAFRTAILQADVVKAEKFIRKFCTREPEGLNLLIPAEYTPLTFTLKQLELEFPNSILQGEHTRRALSLRTILRSVLDHGANPNRPDALGNHPLLYGFNCGADVADMLLIAKAQPGFAPVPPTNGCRAGPLESNLHSPFEFLLMHIDSLRSAKLSEGPQGLVMEAQLSECRAIASRLAHLGYAVPFSRKPYYDFYDQLRRDMKAGPDWKERQNEVKARLAAKREAYSTARQQKLGALPPAQAPKTRA
jgi:hypothetical protein